MPTSESRRIGASSPRIDSRRLGLPCARSTARRRLRFRCLWMWRSTQWPRAMALASSTESTDRGSRMSEMLSERRLAMATLNASPRETRSRWSARSNNVSSGTSRCRIRSWFTRASTSLRASCSASAASPTNRSSNACCGSAASLPAASSSASTPARPASNTPCESVAPEAAESRACIDESARSGGIAPFRRSTCHSASCACRTPMELARRRTLPTLSRRAIVSKCAVMVASARLGESL